MTAPDSLRARLAPEWIAAIASEGGNDPRDEVLLDWAIDTHCGSEVLRVVALADYVISQWPDACADVRQAATHQILVICYG